MPKKYFSIGSLKLDVTEDWVMNKTNWLFVVLGVLGISLAAGCATKAANTAKAVIYETATITKAHDVMAPVSVREEIAESREDTIGGLAGYVSKDGRVSDQVPADMKATLETKRLKHKEMIFEKLSVKAKEAGADAVIGAKYSYTPAYATFSTKAVVTAEGTMVKYS